MPQQPQSDDELRRELHRGRLPDAHRPQPPAADPGTADGPYYDRSDLRTVNEEAAGTHEPGSPANEASRPNAEHPATRQFETDQPPARSHEAARDAETA